MLRPGSLKIKSWKEDPVLFVREVFGIEPDLWQIEALRSLVSKNRNRFRLALKACTGPGKSATLCWIGWWRLACFASKGEHPKGAALSGEGRDNLRDNLWAELAKWRGRAPFLLAAFEWVGERIYARDFPETWFLSARSYPKEADNEAIGRSLSGLHSKYPFILLDEMGDMPPAVGQKAEQIFTGSVEDGLIAGAGNPTSTSGLLYQVSTSLSTYWHVITITADPDDPKRTPRVDIEHAREQIQKYGRDNPWVMSTILGQFPPTAMNTLLSIEEVEAAMNRHLSLDQYEFSQKRLGVDCARFGSDSTVIFPRQGLASFMPVQMRNARTNEIAARVMAAKSRWGSELEFVDDTGGFGSGVIDSLIQAGEAPVSVQFAGKAMDSRYANKRAEMWFLMSEWVKRGGALPNIPELKRELSTPTYTFQNGKFLLEAKDQIKDRLGFSPDFADALCTTFALPDMPSQSAHLQGSYMPQRKTISDYDPFDEKRLSAAFERLDAE